MENNADHGDAGAEPTANLIGEPTTPGEPLSTPGEQPAPNTPGSSTGEHPAPRESVPESAAEDPRAPGGAPWWRRRRSWATIVGLLVLTLLWAGASDLLLELSLRETKWVPLPVPQMVLGTLLIWVFAWCVYGLVGTLRWTLLGLSVVVVALAAINRERVSILLEPLLPSDLAFLGQPDFLLDMIGGTRVAVVAVLGAAVVIAGLWWLQHRFGPTRLRPAAGQSGRTAWWAARGVLVTVGLVLVVVASGFPHQGNPLRRVYDATVTKWRPWSQLENYRANGFVGGALYNLPTAPMNRPRGYGKDAMQAIARRWTERAAQVNAGTDPGVVSRTNVVVVLSESMGDPAALTSVRFPTDPMPNVHRLMAQNWSGRAVAWDYGTGTSAMEFSALTGQSLGLFKPTVISPYQQFVASQKSYPTAVGWLKSTGHAAVAIHPFQTYMYQRKSVYKMFGFDAFLDRNQVGPALRQQKMRYVSDEAALHEVVRQIREQDKPLLTHLVTMQNHLPYGGQYKNPIIPTGVAPDSARKLGQWARGVQITDAALPGFLNAVKQTGEPTTVVWFGDHWPGILGEDVLDREGLNAYRTPFFVWNSETSPSLDGSDPAAPSATHRTTTPKPMTPKPMTPKPATPKLTASNPPTPGIEPSDPGPRVPRPTHRDLGNVSAASFLEIAVRQMGGTLPPWMVLLSEVQAKVGVIRGADIVAPDGRELAWRDLTAEQRALVRDYRMVQYDFSVGKRYAQKELWYAPH